MVVIQSIDDVRGALGGLGPVVGMGVTAFPRIGVVNLLPNFELLCILDSTDLSWLNRTVRITSAKRDFAGKVGKLNTLALLRLPSTQRYLRLLGEHPSLFLYKSSKKIEELADRNGYRLLTNRSDVRDVYEDKWEFRRIAREIAFPLPAGEQLSIDDLTRNVFGKLQEKLGTDLVFQITDYSKGGGVGTFFVSDIEGVDAFLGFVGRRRQAGRDLQRLNVTRRISGESASISGCVTRYGVLTSRIQRQIVDVPEVVGYHGRSGVFCGHDWGERYGSTLEGKAKSLARKLGEQMSVRGYRGIFGLDLVVNRNSGVVWPIECNSRYTGAFPVYSMLQEQAHEIPMDAWHLLEFSGVEYRMDVGAVQRSYDQALTGAQLLLHNLERSKATVRGAVKPGVYRMTGPGPAWPAGRLVNIKWVRGGYSVADLESDSEFVLTDGVPGVGELLKPGSRIGRVIFKRNVMEDRGNQLQPDIRKTMKSLYGLYKLEMSKQRYDFESV
jgi:hypothetical protein